MCSTVKWAQCTFHFTWRCHQSHICTVFPYYYCYYYYFFGGRGGGSNTNAWFKLAVVGEQQFPDTTWFKGSYNSEDRFRTVIIVLLGRDFGGTCILTCSQLNSWASIKWRGGGGGASSRGGEGGGFIEGRWRGGLHRGEVLFSKIVHKGGT